MTSENNSLLDDKLLQQQVIVLVGSGGVGKTTASAAIGLHAARQGRKVLVLTIDPARRLADALGLKAIGNAETEVALTHEDLPAPADGGSLHAMMLDTEGAFDELVSRLATTPESAKAVQENRIYRHIIDSLAGAQEYLAGEKIFDAASSGRYDLVVLDTPPTANALDFLDASRRLVRLLDDRVYRWLLPTVSKKDGKRRAGLVDRLLRAPSNVAKAILARVFGERFVGDLEEFFLVMHGIHREVRRRSEDVQRLLKDPAKTSFLLVTAPIPTVTDNAVFFHSQIRERGYPFAGFILNRVHPAPADAALALSAGAIADGLATSLERAGSADGSTDEPLTPSALAQALHENVQRMADLAARDRETIAELRGRMAATAPMTLVPRLSGAIHDLPGLASVGAHIFSVD
jgi:anion-transporting  ArsA/GET3 family ATPase